MPAALSSPPAPSARVAEESVETVGSPSQVSDGIRTAIEPPNASDGSPRLTAGERAQLKALYQPGAYAPLWTDQHGRPTDRARNVLAVLNGAADHGLDPADYDAPDIGSLAAAPAGAAASQEMAARFDVRLSAALVRYVHHLHAGRIDPHEFGFRVESAADAHEHAALAAAVATGRIAESTAALTPQLDAYEELRASLGRYRTHAADPALTQLPAVARSVHPGDPYAGVSALYRLLLALGDLPADARQPHTASYQGALVEAVIRFQFRHGLAADGVLGARTLEAMNTPLAWRVRQIELGLERLRWLPHAGESRMVLVNVPMFRLWAWDAVPPLGAPAMSSDVIVGRALGTRTPLFVEELREVVFRPYWIVPSSILRHELLPLVRRDPGYLASNDFEIVPAGGGPVVPPTPGNVSRLGRGLDLRQRPGPRNSLGLVKFVFPNQESIYMHDTPAEELFSRSRRDFSHGCVRVRDPVALAEWALAGTPGWTRDRIGSTMLGDETVRVTVVRPTRVVLFYTTAFVWPEDGTVRFAEDIYRQDRELDRALHASKARSGR
jgi:murein L,D-transpeptidase YcbB/YkuD